MFFKVMWIKINKKVIESFFKLNDYKITYRPTIQPTVFYEARKLCWLFNEEKGILLNTVVARQYYQSKIKNPPYIENSNGLCLSDFEFYYPIILKKPDFPR